MRLVPAAKAAPLKLVAVALLSVLVTSVLPVDVAVPTASCVSATTLSVAAAAIVPLCPDAWLIQAVSEVAVPAAVFAPATTVESPPKLTTAVLARSDVIVVLPPVPAKT